LSIEVNQDALRIWALPEARWPEELAKLDKYKNLNNIRWRYRLAVGMRLKMAAQMERAGCFYGSWPERSNRG